MFYIAFKNACDKLSLLHILSADFSWNERMFESDTEISDLPDNDWCLQRSRFSVAAMSSLFSWFQSCSFSAVLKIKAVDPGVVVIQGTEAQQYLAMSDEGRLYSSVSIHNRCTCW